MSGANYTDTMTHPRNMKTSARLFRLVYLRSYNPQWVRPSDTWNLSNIDIQRLQKYLLMNNISDSYKTNYSKTRDMNMVKHIRTVKNIIQCLFTISF